MLVDFEIIAIATAEATTLFRQFLKICKVLVVII